MHAKELLQYSKNLTLLFAEDHEKLRESTTNVLQNFFKEVKSCSNGEEALACYKNNSYDIVLTDLRMPKKNGLELVEEIYKENPQQKVVILSAHDESKYLIPLINLGVEYYIKKPLQHQELLNIFYELSKKIHSENEQPQQNKTLWLTPTVSYNSESFALTKNNEITYLTKYEIIFLNTLIKHPNKIFANEEITEAYRKKSEMMDTQNIRKLVSKLRKKLPEGVIESVYGVGYRLTPKV